MYLSLIKVTYETLAYWSVKKKKKESFSLFQVQVQGKGIYLHLIVLDTLDKGIVQGTK